VVLVKLGRKPEALKAFDRAIALGPAEAKAFSNRAGVLYEFGRFPEALDDCERAIELAPRNAVFHFHKGGVLASLTRWQEALAAYDRAVELDPGLALAHCHRGDILRWLGRDEDAMAAIEQGIARGEFPVVLVSWLAWQLATSPRESLRDGERAVELARRLVDVEPANGNLWNTLGVALCRTDAWEKALAALDESMKRRDGGDSVDWYFVAMAHHALGHYDEAQSWFEKAEQWAAAHAPDDAELHRIHAEVAAFLDEG
jgi:tetratricopeptide (TPR) repeat protein